MRGLGSEYVAPDRVDPEVIVDLGSNASFSAWFFWEQQTVLAAV